MHTMPTPNKYNDTQAPQRRRNLAPVVVVGLLLLAGLLAGAFLIGRGSQVDASNVRATSLGAKQGGQVDAAAGTTTTDAPADGDAVIVVSDGTDTGAPTQAPSNPAPANTTPPAPPAQPNPQPSAPAPVITSFSTPENIDCHNGMSQTFTASWSTTNASSVTISIDGPGVYKSYGPTGSDSLPFNCSSSHTFLLTAHGANGQVATKSITLQPRNVQMPESADADEQ